MLQGSNPNLPILVIKNRAGFWQALDLKELWKYRELIYFLTLRDIKIRFKQAALGVAWVLAQPLFLMATYTFLFSKVAKLDSQGIPYQVFSLCALIPWGFFSSALNKGSLSLTGSGALFSKVYFPRVIIPIAAILASLIDYLVGLCCFLVMLGFYGYSLSWAWIIGIPVVTLWLFILSCGVSFWLGALNVKYRDVGHLLPFLAQVWMFLTPIVYPFSVIPDRYQFWVSLNPMVGIINAFRSVFFNLPVDYSSMALSLLVTSLFCAFGLAYFLKTERSFADII